MPTPAPDSHAARPLLRLLPRRRRRPVAQPDVEALIARLELSDAQKHALRLRWLVQVRAFHTAGERSYRLYMLYRTFSLLGGGVLTGLIGLLIGGRAPGWLRQLTWDLSILVGVSGTLEEFFHAGERWQIYRYTEELLTSEGWQFLQLGGDYRTYNGHGDAFPDFASRVEELTQRASSMYLGGVMRDPREDLLTRTKRTMQGQPDS